VNWLYATGRKRRLRKAFSETVFWEVYSDFPWTELERQHIFLGGPRRPLGDVVSGEFFLSDPNRRSKYLFALTKLIECYSRILQDDRTVFPPNCDATTSEAAEAIDSVLDYLLNAVEFVVGTAGGFSPAGAAAFFTIPRAQCGKRTRSHIEAIERNERLLAGLRELAERGR
jgi:hypothetical protein